MAITFRSFAVASGNVSDITIGKPTGTVDGDQMIAVIGTDGAGAAHSLTGWTQLEFATNGGTMSVTMLEREASGEGADFTFLKGGGAAGTVGQVLTLQHTSGNWDTPISSIAHADPNASLTTTSVTAALNDLLVVAFFNDGNRAITTDPTSDGMTITENTSFSSFSGAAYHQASLSAGGITKSITYAVSDQISGLAVIISDDAAVGGRIMSSLVYTGGLAGAGGIAGRGGGLAG